MGRLPSSTSCLLPIRCLNVWQVHTDFDTIIFSLRDWRKIALAVGTENNSATAILQGSIWQQTPMLHVVSQRCSALRVCSDPSAAQITRCKQAQIACISIVDPRDVPVGLAGTYYAEDWIENACCVYGCHLPWYRPYAQNDPTNSFSPFIVACIRGPIVSSVLRDPLRHTGTTCWPSWTDDREPQVPPESRTDLYK